MLGPSSQVEGLWFAEGIWVTHAGGSGRAVAELMTTGRSEIDMRQSQPRPLPAVPDHPRLRPRPRRAELPGGLRHHPPAPADGAPARPAHPALPAADRGGRRRAVESAGWERAQWYESNAGLPAPPSVQRRDEWAARLWSPIIGREHHATREACGIFDLTPFTKVEIEGPGAVDWLNRVCASEMDRPVGKVIYTTVLDEYGGVVCDLTVTRTGEDRFLVVTGGGSGPRDVAWLRRHLPEGGGVTA